MRKRRKRKRLLSKRKRRISSMRRGETELGKRKRKKNWTGERRGKMAVVLVAKR